MNVRRWPVAVLVAAAGVALRVWVYRGALGTPDADEAVVGLMARHVVHGQFTTFYWGQPYGGPQEAWLVAPVLAIAGPRLLALRSATIALTAVTVWLVWRVGLRTIGERAAAAAAGLFWLWPPYDVFWLVHERGFYGSDVAYCALLLLLALRVAESPRAGRVAVFGLALGLAFWQTAQIVPVALPVIAWIAWRRPASLRRAWAGVAGFVVGALPWLVWNGRHDWASLPPRASLHEYAHSLRLLVSPLLPMLLGLRAPFTAQTIVPSALMYALYAALAAGFAYGAVRSVRTDASLLYAVAVAFPLIWAFSRRVDSQTSIPLYLVVVSPVVVLLVSQLGRRPLPAVALLAVAGVVTVVTLQRMHTLLATDTSQFAVPTPRNLAPLTTALDRERIDRVFTDYWLAYRLTFATDERIVATYGAPGTPPSAVRWPPYQREVEEAPRHAFVYLRTDQVAAPHGYRRATFGPYVLFLPRH